MCCEVHNNRCFLVELEYQPIERIDICILCDVGYIDRCAQHLANTAGVAINYLVLIHLFGPHSKVCHLLVSGTPSPASDPHSQTPSARSSRTSPQSQIPVSGPANPVPLERNIACATVPRGNPALALAPHAG